MSRSSPFGRIEAVNGKNVMLTWTIRVYQLAFMAKFFQFWKNNYVSCAFITIGWYFMVTGQSLVLYSRLHLIVRDSRKLKWILYMIITDVFLFHIPTTVFTFGVGFLVSLFPILSVCSTLLFRSLPLCTSAEALIRPPKYRRTRTKQPSMLLCTKSWKKSK